MIEFDMGDTMTSSRSFTTSNRGEPLLAGYKQCYLYARYVELDLSASSTDDDDPHVLNDGPSSDTEIAVDASPLIESDARLLRTRPSRGRPITSTSVANVRRRERRAAQRLSGDRAGAALVVVNLRVQGAAIN